MRSSVVTTADIKSSNNDAVVSGRLCFKTVGKLRALGNQLIKAKPRLTFDLQNVTYSDSSGLALLISWLGFADKKQKQIVFKHVPASLLAIAKVSNLDKILPFE